jgi:hypothetical protein
MARGRTYLRVHAKKRAPRATRRARRPSIFERKCKKDARSGLARPERPQKGLDWRRCVKYYMPRALRAPAASKLDFVETRFRPSGANTEDARRGAIVGAGGGLAVVEGVDHMLRAGEAVGVGPGCDIGVEEVVLVPDGLE